MGRNARTGGVLLLLTLAAAVIAVLSVGPVPQDPGYHNFADHRSLWGIANFGDVMSNLPFAAIGIYALARLLAPEGRRIFVQPADRWPWLVFFIGVTAVCIGSSYYHLAPANDRLFWDRLPMTVAFMALFAGFIADRVNREAGLRLALPLLLVIGAASAIYWDRTEAAGHGDLRFYGLVQFYPMLAIPLICWFWRRRHYTQGRFVAIVLGWYVLAKLLETFDPQVLGLTGGLVSGHSLKHVAAAIGPLYVLRMLQASRRQ